MVDNTAAFMALDAQSQGAIAPYISGPDVVQASRGAMLAFLQKVQDAMPWAPSNLVSVGSQVLALGAFPRLRAFVPGQKRPAWLTDEGHYQAWRKMITEGYAPIDAAFLKQNAALTAAETNSAAANAAFWNAVATYSGEDALENLWNDLQNAIADIRAQRDSALLSLNTAKGIIAAYGSRVPVSLASQTAAIAAEMAALDSRARTVLAPIPAAAPAAGLGLAPLAIAGIAAGTLAAITASVWAIAHEFAAVQIKAGTNAQDLLKWRENQDRADFEAGKITNEQLVQRRQENVAAANSIVDSQGAASVGRGFGAAGAGLAAGIGAVLLLAFGGYMLYKHTAKR